MSAPVWRVVIVNYRTGDLAKKSALAARQAVGRHGDIVVVDSASGDDSAALLDDIDGVRLLALTANRGYGAALNAGAAVQPAAYDYLLCQNADVVVSPDVVPLFEERFARLARLAICAPRLLSADGTIQPSCRRFPTPATILWSRRSPLAKLRGPSRGRYILPEPPSFTLCDVVAGACFGIRRSVWDALGGMDEGFFLYAEDTDLCRRAKSAGWLVGYEPATVVHHAWGASTHADRGTAMRHHAQSIDRYLNKHFPHRTLTQRMLSWALRIQAYLHQPQR